MLPLTICTNPRLFKVVAPPYKTSVHKCGQTEQHLNIKLLQHALKSTFIGANPDILKDNRRLVAEITTWPLIMPFGRIKISFTMKSWLETASGMDEATLSCMLAEPREALLPIRGRENLEPKKRDRTLEPCSLSEDAYLSSSGGSPCAGLSREERRRRRRATLKYRTAHATRERIRVEAFNAAFASLRRLLPTLPPDKKLSKIEILRLAICYIAYLNHVLDA